jgi:hypothetical protein
MKRKISVVALFIFIVIVIFFLFPRGCQQGEGAELPSIVWKAGVEGWQIK